MARILYMICNWYMFGSRLGAILGVHRKTLGDMTPACRKMLRESSRVLYEEEPLLQAQQD